MRAVNRAPTKERKYRHRQRDIVFSPVDEAVFCLAIRQLVPTAFYIGEDQWQGPPPVFASSIECPDRRQIRIYAPDDEGWPQRVREYEPGWSCFSDTVSERILYFHPSRWDWGPQHIRAKWAWDPPTLSMGWMTGSFWPEEKKQIAFVRQVWRVIERIATNRIRKGHPLGNTLMGIEQETMDIKGGSDWVGHHALEWSRAGGNRRMLNGCIRPCEDWAPPQDPWYRALRAEVAERYGPALGEPPEDAVPTASGLLSFPPAG